MIFSLNALYKRYISTEVKRFILVGSSTVLLDLFCYYGLIQFGIESSISKGSSFTIGAIYAYLVNKNFTFQIKNYGLFQFSLFMLLYLSTLLINVFTNEILLNFFGRTHVSFILAFLSATFLSAALNFLGMKYLVFSKKDS